MEFGLYTFADVAPDRKPGHATNTHQRIKDVLEEIQLADQLGFDVFALGEHHRPDYAVSSPAVLLAAAAAITKNIRLSSAVTVLSSDDPVRVFQSFATLDQSLMAALKLWSAGEVLSNRSPFLAMTLTTTMRCFLKSWTS